MLRSLTLGEALDAALALYRRLFAPLFVISFVTQVAPLTLAAFIDAAGGPLLHPGFWFVGIALGIVLGALGTAATTFLVSEHYLGRSIAPSQALRAARGFMGRLVALTFASGLVVGVGFVFFIIPGVILFSGLILGTPAMVIENLPGATDAMQRSWKLSRGFRGKVLGGYILVFMLLLVPTLAIDWVASSIGITAGGYSVVAVLLRLLESVVQVLIFPFLYVLTTVLYYDVRVRKEAFDLEMLASSLQPA